MDRVEAYSLLTAQMDDLVKTSTALSSIEIGRVIVSDVLGINSTSYRIEMQIQKNPDGGYSVLGNIHDNNSQRFSLLEEQLDFDVSSEN